MKFLYISQAIALLNMLLVTADTTRVHKRHVDVRIANFKQLRHFHLNIKCSTFHFNSEFVIPL